ncbi:MAG: M48 family metallopeptidase [Planctomycetota bacterium]
MTGLPGFPGHPRPNKPAPPPAGASAGPPGDTTRPPAPSGARPADRPRSQAAKTIDDKIAEGVSAYPNNITFHELIARNKRHSVWLIVAMYALAVALGAVMGAALAPFFGGIDRAVTTVDETSLGVDLSAWGDVGALLPAAGVGAALMAVVAGLGSVWSFYGGSKAVLRMSGARRISKELDPQLFNVTEEMAIAAGVPMPELYLIGDSALNTFATGRDPEHGAVAITVGLRQKLSRDELQAVIAHEIAHIRHYDIRFGTLMATLVGIIVIACDAFLHGSWRVALVGGAGRGGGRKSGGGPAVIVLLVVAAVLAIVAPFIARLIQMTYSRQREYLADAGAVELTRNPGAMASALRRLADDPDPLVDTANRGVAHMYIVNPLKKMHDSHQSLDSLLCSHPPLAKRISRLLALLR